MNGQLSASELKEAHVKMDQLINMMQQMRDEDPANNDVEEENETIIETKVCKYVQKKKSSPTVFRFFPKINGFKSISIEDDDACNFTCV